MNEILYQLDICIAGYTGGGRSVVELMATLFMEWLSVAN